MERKARVLIVEDDAAIRTSVAVTLRDDDYDVHALADGIGLEDAVRRIRPDLAILDVRLQAGPNGYQMASMLRRSVDVSILFLTAADGLDARLAGFRAGADDYLVKPFALAELLARVKALLRRSGRLGFGLWEVGDLVVDEAARTVERGGVALELTGMERALLSAFARHPGQVLSKGQLLAEVWGFDSYDVNLVEVHMSSLRRKLEAHGPRLLHTVRGAGYVLRT